MDDYIKFNKFIVELKDEVNTMTIKKAERAHGLNKFNQQKLKEYRKNLNKTS